MRGTARRWRWLVLLLAVVALIGAGCSDDSGGDDEASEDTGAPAESTTTTTEAATTTVAPTEPPPDAEPVTDDTGKFSVLVPPTAEVDTAPFEVEGYSIPHVSAADDLDEYNDGYDADGYTVMAVPPEVVSLTVALPVPPVRVTTIELPPFSVAKPLALSTSNVAVPHV